MELADGVASQHRRVAWVKHGLIACIVLGIVAVLSNLGQYDLLNDLAAGVSFDDGTIEANDDRQRLIAWLQRGALVFTAACWLVWFHRAYGNLKLLGRKHAHYGAGWAVGYWFIPLAHLVIPYQMTREIWLKSASAGAVTGEPRRPRARWLGFWWAGYLTNGVLGRVAAVLSNDAESPDEWVFVTQLSMVGDLSAIVAAVLALVVVSSIDRLQLEAVRAAAPEPAVALA
ncbi:MAG: DUF4328 domain-containing protein [Planctomycetes bacterium]|nr:DUF4328 domain-containing protein [Planctomycetota bacterium]